ncbi:MAG: hypothetical protein ACXVAY_02890 [Mucilaginibacter sp.]
MKKITLLIMLLFALACKQKEQSPQVQIALVNNNKSLQIQGMDYLILKEIAADTGKHWESLFAVYRMPTDTDLKDDQPLQPGKYLLRDSALVFTPDTPFMKNQPYFLRYYKYGGNSNVWDFVRGKKRPGKMRFTDLIFKQ